jgi:hypothetical protein
VRLLLLLSLEETRSLRRELYESIGDFHLLRFRLFQLSNSLRTPSSAQAHIDEHWRMVEWQLRRIYRTRNALVHDGRTPRYLGALIENGHDYLDMVLDEILDHSCGPRRAETLDEAFAMESILFEKFRAKIGKTTQFSAENIGVLYQQPLYRPRPSGKQTRPTPQNSDR